VIAVQEFFSHKAEKPRMLLLLIACIVILLAFWSRFPREAPPVEVPAIGVEGYFNTGWEIDSAGGFVWVLNDKNKFIIANNENVEKSGYLDIQIVGAPCGGSHEVTIISKSVIPERVSVSANQKSEIQLQLTLDPYARVPVFVNVTGRGCKPSATDGRLIKVQVRQPIFVPS
jgi:hypothetical protein